jgi:hypothetical protein
MTISDHKDSTPQAKTPHHNLLGSSSKKSKVTPNQIQSKDTKKTTKVCC